MTMTADEFQSYASLDKLQHASDQLIESLPDEELPASDADNEALFRCMTQFIDQAAATGTMLDAPADRRAAQAIIDFWLAKSYAIPRETRSRQRTSTKASIVLRPFDPTTVTSAIGGAEEFLKRLDEKDSDLAGGILVRMVRVDDSNGTYNLASIKREDLASLGSSSRVDGVVNALMSAGILTSVGHAPDQTLRLRSDALIRHWPRLNKLVDERVNYRNMALNWKQTGMRSGTLLDWSTTRKLKSFGNLSDVELAFTSASESYNLKVFGLGTASLIFLSLLFLYIYPTLKSSPSYVNYFSAGIEERVKKGPTRTESDLRWLSDHGKKIEAQGGSIANMDLSGLSASLSNFSNLTLNSVKFDRANLSAAVFLKDVVDGVSFRGASLNFASFKESTFRNRNTFENADLSNAKFEEAKFCPGVELSDAKVEGASFAGTKFLNESVPNVSNTAWWLAKDWGDDQRKLLAEKYSGAGIEKSDHFKKELGDIQISLVMAETSLKDTSLSEADRDTLVQRQASWLNDKAWVFAKYGVVRPNEDPNLDGERLARNSLKLLDGLIAKAEAQGNARAFESHKNMKAAVSDTLAYILMQRKDLTPLQRDETIQLLETAIAFDDGEIYFRMALALNSFAANDPRIIEYLEKSLRDKKHVPTHDRYLLARLITPEFQQAMARFKTAKTAVNQSEQITRLLDEPVVRQNDKDPCAEEQPDRKKRS